MNHKFFSGMVLFASLHVASVAGAQGQAGSMRCETRLLRCESSYYACQARCERTLNAHLSPATDAALAADTTCHTACDARHTRKQHRIQTTAPCQTIYNTPDTLECEALSLSLQADYMICELRCSNRLHPEDCLSACTKSCTGESQNLQSQPVCSLGRVTTTPLCN
jgi:hypothetical protein